MTEFDFASLSKLSGNITPVEIANKIYTNLCNMQDAPDDIGCIINFQARRVGFVSEGDYPDRMKDLVDFFRSEPCDFVIMAVNDKCLNNFKISTANDTIDPISTKTISKGPNYVAIRRRELIQNSLSILAKMLQKCP